MKQNETTEKAVERTAEEEKMKKAVDSVDIEIDSADIVEEKIVEIVERKNAETVEKEIVEIVEKEIVDIAKKKLLKLLRLLKDLLQN